MMAYIPNIPQANDIPAQSQQLILDNFTEINTFVNVDHGAFNSALEGAHKKISFIPQIAPIAWPAGVSCGLYANANGIFVHNVLPLPGTPDVNITRKFFNANGDGYYYLPCGLLVKFGHARTNSGPVDPGHLTVNIDMDLLDTPYNAVPFVFLTSRTEPFPNGASTTICVRFLTQRFLNVNIRDTLAGAHIDAEFQWMAIGTY